MSNTSLKFIEAEIVNYKNISSKIVNIGGRSLVILGGNNKSKSSFIEALRSPFDSSVVAPEPIKSGEEKGHVKVKIAGELDGKEVEYNISHYFTPGNKKGRLVVERADGDMVNKPATVLKNLVGNISFDIFDFLKWKTEKQIETLKQLTGKAVEIDGLTAEYKKIYEERSELNRKVSDLESTIKDNKYTDEQIDLYEKLIDPRPIQEEMTNIGKSLETYSGVTVKLDRFIQRRESIKNEVIAAEEAIEGYRRLITEKENFINSLAKETVELDSNIEKGNTWLSKTPKPDTTEIITRLNAANEHNKHHEAVMAFSKKYHDLIGAKNDVLDKNDELDKVTKKKEAVIKNSSLPIEGLSFTDSEVLYNGLPLDITQINTAKIIEIGMEISMALNPNLKVIFIKDGSLLDRGSMETVLKSAEAKGYQVMMEVVEFEGGDAEIEFTEDFLIKRKSKNE